MDKLAKTINLHSHFYQTLTLPTPRIHLKITATPTSYLTTKNPLIHIPIYFQMRVRKKIHKTAYCCTKEIDFNSSKLLRRLERLLTCKNGLNTRLRVVVIAIHNIQQNERRNHKCEGIDKLRIAFINSSRITRKQREQ